MSAFSKHVHTTGRIIFFMYWKPRKGFCFKNVPLVLYRVYIFFSSLSLSLFPVTTINKYSLSFTTIFSHWDFGKPAAPESRYPTHSACCFCSFVCFHDPPNSDMDYLCICGLFACRLMVSSKGPLWGIDRVCTSFWLRRDSPTVGTQSPIMKWSPIYSEMHEFCHCYIVTDRS